MINVFKALSDENRLRILNLLIKTELCVCEIETILNMTQSNVSRHLSKLKAVNIISASKDAQWVHYTLNSDFANSNLDLINYITSKLIEGVNYQQDLKLLNNYFKHGFTCSDIRCDKNHVINTIKMEDII